MSEHNNTTSPETTQQQKETKPRRRALRIGIGIALGAVAGFAYYYFIGCNSGGCPITSSPYISTIYGSVVGAVAANI